MRLGLMLAERQNRGVPAVGLQAAGVVERKAGVVAELGTGNAVRLILVIERGPLAGHVPLGKGRTGGQHDQRQHEANVDAWGYIMGMMRAVVACVLAVTVRRRVRSRERPRRFQSCSSTEKAAARITTGSA